MEWLLPVLVVDRELQEFLSACRVNHSNSFLGKRDEQKLKVRERLMKEGLALFSSSGFEKTTVAHIVEKSEIARGTFYNYFPIHKNFLMPSLKSLIKILKQRFNKQEEIVKMYTIIFMEPSKTILN
jgi:hypothetical protein